MKVEIQIDSAQMVAEITREVVKAIKPFLGAGRVEDDTLLTRKGAMLAQCYACNGLDGSRVDCGGKLSCPMYEYSPYKPETHQE